MALDILSEQYICYPMGLTLITTCSISPKKINYGDKKIFSSGLGLVALHFRRIAHAGKNNKWLLLSTQAHLYTAKEMSEQRGGQIGPVFRRNCCILVSAHCAAASRYIIIQCSPCALSTDVSWSSVVASLFAIKKYDGLGAADEKNKSDEQVLFHNNSCWHRKMSRLIFSTDFSLRRSVCETKIGAPLMQIYQSLILHDLCESACGTSGHQNPMFV
jgi:hypothetical protein